MKTKKITSKSVKAINNLYSVEMLSPFKVLNWINTNRNKRLEDGVTISDLLSSIGLKKLSLSDLLNYTDGYGNNVICNLVPAGKEVPVYYDIMFVNGRSYKLVPLRYTINDFFKSLNDALKIQQAKEAKEERYTKMYNALLDKKEAAAKSEKDKEADKVINKIVSSLRLIPLYASFSDTELRSKAIELLSTKVA